MASSDMRSGVQGGSQVSSISTSSTPSTADATLTMSSLIIGPAGQPIDETVDHLDPGPVDLDVVEQPEVDDVHPELGILDRAERSTTSSFVGMPPA